MPIGIGGVGITLLIVGILTSLAPHRDEKITFQNAQDVKGIETSVNPLKLKQIVVYVSGAVLKDGIYSLSLDSLVKDALDAG